MFKRFLTVITIGAGLMAGCVKGSGKYDYLVKKHDATACSIDFIQAGKVIGNSTFTIDDAKKAGTQNLDKFPRNMLFARAMSNGVKWFCPDVFTMPVYTPEEMGDTSITEDIDHTEVAVSAPPSPAKTKLNAKAIKDAVGRIANGETQLIEMIKGTFDITADQLKELEGAVPSTIIATPAEGATIVEKA